MAETDITPPEDSPQAAPVRPARRAWFRAILAGTALLLCGAVIGSSVAVFVVKRAVDNRRNNPESMPARAAQRITNDLDLDPEQQTHVQAIVDRRHERLGEIRREFGQASRTELRAMHEEIAAILTTEQRARWDQRWEDLMERERERREKWEKKRRDGRDDDASERSDHDRRHPGYGDRDDRSSGDEPLK